MSLQYLSSLFLPSETDEAGYILDSHNPNMTMTVYDDNVYPFNLFPLRIRGKIRFSPITVFCGGNGSGKSTLLNIIAEALSLDRVSAFNKTHHFASYVSMCSFELAYGKKVPAGSAIITSDDVFDSLLTRREENDAIDVRRRELSEEYFALRKAPSVLLQSLDEDDIREFRRKNDANRKTPSRFIAERLREREKRGGSNGEEAFLYFTKRLDGSALFLLDEPENSLSPRRQLELVRYIEDSVRFFDCQFIIATHSPFFTSLRGALIYDLDETPVRTKKWTELDGVRTYMEFFRERGSDFQ